jgi:hypothetical protein
MSLTERTEDNSESSDEESEERLYTVQRILAERQGEDGEPRYLVHWKDYPIIGLPQLEVHDTN